MTEDTLRWPGGWARIGAWRGRADIGYLLVAAAHPPTSETIERCLRVLRRHGYGSVVTNALGPVDTLPFVDAGFSVHERLHLLTHDLERIPDVANESRRARPRDRADVLALDARAFRPFWQLDAQALASAVEATPSTRFRVVPSDTGIAAYGITGRSGRQGYLQRIGVDPELQGRGLGHAMVADALRWLRRHRARGAVVNTQLDNEAALTLYRACGFREMSTGLCVMGRSL